MDEKTRQSNRLKECLKRYFPQLPRWFEDVTTTVVGALLERWPNLEELQRAHPGTLRRFFHQHHCRSEDLIRERIDAISHATSATKDAALLEAGAMTARGLVALISTLRRIISDFDQRIEQLVATSRRRSVCLPAGRRTCIGSPPDRSFRHPPRSLPRRLSNALLQRYCSR